MRLDDFEQRRGPVQGPLTAVDDDFFNLMALVWLVGSLWLGSSDYGFIRARLSFDFRDRWDWALSTTAGGRLRLGDCEQRRGPVKPLTAVDDDFFYLIALVLLVS